MKKLFLLAVASILLSATHSFAQSSYKTAVGLSIDFGNGSTLVGPSIKHFFSRNDALLGELTFGGDATYIGGFYQYHQPFKQAPELKWYLGLGPQVGFGNGSSAWFLRPQAGLDYKVKSAPISLVFDWRPILQLSDGSDFEAGRFGLGFRYTFE